MSGIKLNKPLLEEGEEGKENPSNNTQGTQNRPQDNSRSNAEYRTRTATGELLYFGKLNTLALNKDSFDREPLSPTSPTK